MSLENTYIQYGVPSNWAHEYDQKGISVSTFKQTSKRNLLEKYNISKPQIDFVKNCLLRKPIDENIIFKLLENSRFVCCLCKGQKSDAYIIHHIIEYSQSQDNTYPNLAVLCPNDHDLAHRNGNALTNKITEQQIREAKKNWEQKVKEENKIVASKKLIKGEIKDWKEQSLFKELQSFTEADKDLFFGRTLEVDELLKKINTYRIVGLFGESGTGKTSLLNAGLIPSLKKDGFITVSIRCLDEPIKRLREELFKTLKDAKVLASLIEELATTDTFSHLILKLKAIVEKEDLNILITIDQFEELFTRAREAEREQLSKGIIESLISIPGKGKLYFLFSLREDYIGDLWDWSHSYKLEDAWIHQYRIKRLSEEKAYDAIVQPLHSLSIKTDCNFIYQLISELKNLGDGLIYPPYLQIVCTELFEEYKFQNSSLKPLIKFDQNLYKETNKAETIIADYLSESMLKELTEDEKVFAQNILDLLTGYEGLRTFLSIEDICRHLTMTFNNAQHVIEHLIKKKIVIPVVENDQVIGYEIIHDFLSKKFFDKLGPEAKKAKTTFDIFHKAFREWKQHEVLASKDRLELLFPNIEQLILNDEEWTFLIKSSFSVYWHFENKWIYKIEKERLSNICMNLLRDKDVRIVEHSISSLGKLEGEKITSTLIEIIESSETSDSVKEEAIRQYMYSISDIRILSTLKDIIKNNKNSKLRKSAVYAFARNLNKLLVSNKDIVEKEIEILYYALNDSKTEVRREVANVLGYPLLHKRSINPLILRLQNEISISSRKAIVSSLSIMLHRNLGKKQIFPILDKVSKDEDEDYRVREEAKRGLSNI